jgi:hypothetical protein
MTYDRAMHHRRSIRLNVHDQGRAGELCVTVRTEDWACLFATVAGEAMCRVENVYLMGDGEISVKKVT